MHSLGYDSHECNDMQWYSSLPKDKKNSRVKITVDRREFGTTASSSSYCLEPAQYLSSIFNVLVIMIIMLLLKGRLF